MLGKLFGGIADFALRHERASRIAMAAAAAGGAALGIDYLSADAGLSNLEQHAVNGSMALFGGYLAYTAPFLDALRFLRETGKGIGYLFRKKNKKEGEKEKGNSLLGKILEHPLAAASAASAAYMAIPFFGEDFWKGISFGAKSLPIVFGGAYASTVLISMNFHPKNIGHSGAMISAQMYEMMGMRNRAIKALESVENPTKRQQIYLASLYMKEGRIDKALPTVKDSYDNEDEGFFNPAPAAANLWEAADIGIAISRARMLGGLEYFIEPAVRLHEHSRTASQGFWRQARMGAGPQNELELMIAEAYFLDSAGDNGASEKWNSVIDRAEMDERNKIGDHPVLKVPLGRILNAVFALKVGDRSARAGFEDVLRLTKLHRQLVSTDEFLTADAIAVIEREPAYYLATKYSMGMLLAMSGNTEDYVNTSRFLARTHARMPLIERKYDAWGKYEGSVRSSGLPEDTQRRLIENSRGLFCFDRHFPDVFERDSHNEQYTILADGIVEAIDIEDKGNNKPFEDQGKLASLGTCLSYAQKAEMADGYLREHSANPGQHYPDRELFFPASLAGSLRCALRFYGFAMEKGGSRLEAGRVFLENGIEDARYLLEKETEHIGAEEGKQIEKAADIAEKEILPHMTIA